MQNNEDILYLDNEGYQKHLKKIEKYIDDLDKIDKQIELLKGGDFNHLELQELTNNRIKLKNKILKKKTQKIQIIEKSSNEETLDIGDTVKINTYYIDNEPEEEICELITGDSYIEDEVEKTNINGPKGKILFGSKVGETKYFTINKKLIRVDILEKMNAKKLVKEY